MKVGDIVKMKSAPAGLSFGPARRGGLGIVLEGAHRTKRGQENAQYSGLSSLTRMHSAKICKIFLKRG